MSDDNFQIIKTEDGYDTLFSEKYKETYHSKFGVLQEARHVFLNGSGVLKRFEQGLETHILEIGFGTGFNFFLTAFEAVKQNTVLYYQAIENNLISNDIFAQLNHKDLLPQNATIKEFYSFLTRLNPGDQDTYLHSINNIHLKLKLADAITAVLPESKFNAVYLDAFSPDVNPDLWSTTFFFTLKSSMKKGASLSTYSAKSNVRKAMLDAGFEVVRKKGAKGKREMLVAKKSFID